MISIACWKHGPRGMRVVDKELDQGHVITRSTNNALAPPLSDPLLFLIQAMITRVIPMKAAAGFPLFPVLDCGDDGDDFAVPTFTDNTFVNWLGNPPQLSHHMGLTDPDFLPRATHHADRFPPSSTSGAGSSDADAIHHISKTLNSRPIRPNRPGEWANRTKPLLSGRSIDDC